MKPKIALVKDGFLPPGSENVRGRLSAAAIDRLKELASQGWNIDGYSVSKSEDSVTVERVASNPNEVAEPRPEIRSEKEWRVVTSRKHTGMRNCCATCGASYTHCPCPQPTAWVDYATREVVSFKPVRN